MTSYSPKIWDLRTGSILDTIRYEHPITGLQFDSRKIVAAAGENGVRVRFLPLPFFRTFADLSISLPVHHRSSTARLCSTRRSRSTAIRAPSSDCASWTAI